MRKASVVLYVLAVIGFIALSATVARAGGGEGGGSPVLGAWQCYLINGDQPPPANEVVDLVDQFGTRQNVRVGHARLLCAPVTGTKPAETVPAEFDALPDGADHIKCYTISPFDRGPNGRLRLNNPDAVVDVTDELDLDRGVNVGSPVFLCTLAQKCPSGGCPPAP